MWPATRYRRIVYVSTSKTYPDMSTKVEPLVTPLPLNVALRKHRLRTHLTQTQVATKLDTHQAAVSQMENGHPVSTADLFTLIRLYDYPPELMEHWIDRTQKHISTTRKRTQELHDKITGRADTPVLSDLDDLIERADEHLASLHRLRKVLTQEGPPRAA